MSDTPKPIVRGAWRVGLIWVLVVLASAAIIAASIVTFDQ
jgi:hypothetical protein